LAPRLKKDTMEANLQPLGPMFQLLLIAWHQCSSILLVTWCQTTSPKCNKVGSQVFSSASTPSVKWA
jgi:hypothetical protein